MLTAREVCSAWCQHSTPGGKVNVSAASAAAPLDGHLRTSSSSSSPLALLTAPMWQLQHSALCHADFCQSLWALLHITHTLHRHSGHCHSGHSTWEKKHFFRVRQGQGAASLAVSAEGGPWLGTEALGPKCVWWQRADPQISAIPKLAPVSLSAQQDNKSWHSALSQPWEATTGHELDLHLNLRALATLKNICLLFSAEYPRKRKDFLRATF